MMTKPFSLLIKPASADCNLRCAYCFYIDRCALYPETSRHRMSDDVLEQMISGYMATEQPIYLFGWQGGEPTLMGVDFFRRVVDLQTKYGKRGARVSNGLQTNATLIDDEYAAFLAEYHFLLGVSVDGPEEVHNHYRVTASGSGSHGAVMKGIECLNRNHVEYNALTLVSSANVKRAKEVYHYLCDNGIYYHQYIPCVEFDEKAQPSPFTISGKEWGDFLCDIFDEWIHGDTRRVSIRLFDSLLTLMVEGAYTICHMGGNCCQYFVVEYNGDIYPCDFFVEGKRRLGNLMENTWEELQESSLYRGFGQEKNRWNGVCQDCEFLDYCSGDCLKHRLYRDNDPEQISWLCEGWQQFYRHALPELKKLASSIIRERERHGIKRENGKKQLFPDGAVGRNDPCFCGSGKKYKKCHGGR